MALHHIVATKEAATERTGVPDTLVHLAVMLGQAERACEAAPTLATHISALQQKESHCQPCRTSTTRSAETTARAERTTQHVSHISTTDRHVHMCTIDTCYIHAWCTKIWICDGCLELPIEHNMTGVSQGVHKVLTSELSTNEWSISMSDIRNRQYKEQTI